MGKGKRMDRERIERLRAENIATREILCVAFPHTFFPKGAAKRPLKIGIFKDIRAKGHEVPYRTLKRALHDYCSGPLYLKAMKAGEPRLDLDGYTAGFVSEEHATHAAKQLAEINARKARKAKQHRPSKKDRHLKLATVDGVAA
jgi:sRNA-binding protein